jgi:hypothetical protein
VSGSVRTPVRRSRIVRIRRRSQTRRTRRTAADVPVKEDHILNNIIYIAGLVVIIAAVLGYFGFR